MYTYIYRVADKSLARPTSRCILFDSEYISFDAKLNSVALVRERTIPTERPPPVGEVSANFCG